MNYALDTNMCIYFLRGDYPEIARRIESLTVSSLSVTTITVAELYYGVFHSARVEKNLHILGEFLKDFEILPFDLKAARQFGQIKEALLQQGKPVGPYDLLIASIVRSRGYTLVTHNIKEFSQIDGLLIEDWTRE